MGVLVGGCCFCVPGQCGIEQGGCFLGMPYGGLPCQVCSLAICLLGGLMPQFPSWLCLLFGMPL